MAWMRESAAALRNICQVSSDGGRLLILQERDLIIHRRLLRQIAFELQNQGRIRDHLRPAAPAKPDRRSHQYHSRQRNEKNADQESEQKLFHRPAFSVASATRADRSLLGRVRL